MAKDRFMALAHEGGKSKSGARHLRRKAEKLAKRYPSQTAEALEMLERKAHKEGKKRR